MCNPRPASQYPSQSSNLETLACVLDLHRDHLNAFYGKSAKNPADVPSSFEDRDDYEPTGEWVAHFQASTGYRSVDRLATATNNICQWAGGGTGASDPGTSIMCYRHCRPIDSSCTLLSKSPDACRCPTTEQKQDLNMAATTNLHLGLGQYGLLLLLGLLLLWLLRLGLLRLLQQVR